MKKVLHFGLLTALMLLFILPATAEDRNFIYAIGADNQWRPPTTAVEGWDKSFNDNSKLYETSPGSKVYEGLIQKSEWNTDVWMRFITELSDSDNPSIYWKENCIMPYAPDDVYYVDGQTPEYKNGVFTAKCMYKKYAGNREPGTWHFETDASELFCRVDLNKNEVSFIPGNNFYIVNKDDANPTIETVDNYILLNSDKRFLAPGNYQFKLYSLATQKLYTPGTIWQVDVYNNRNYPLVEGGSGFWNIKDFPGGMISGYYNSNNIILNFYPSVAQPKKLDLPEKLYLVGNFCNWSHSEDYTLQHIGNNEWVGTLPAGAAYFKICSEPSWDGINIGCNKLSTFHSGHPMIGIDIDDTIDFSISPMAEDIKIHLYANAPGNLYGLMLENNSIIVYGVNLGYDNSKWLQNAEPTAPEGDFIWVNYVKNPETLTSENLRYIHKNYNRLEKIEEGIYRGNISIPGDTPFNFITSLEADRNNHVMFAPDTDRRFVTDAQGYYLSHATSTGYDDAGYWFTDATIFAEVTVDLNNNTLEMTIPANQASSENLYLIGSPQGWNIEDGRMQLEAVNRRLYYGSFDIQDGDLFRFYTELGDWNNNSIGSQWEDSPIDIWFFDNHTNLSWTHGKGAWKVNGWTGGRMYMLVDLNNGTVELSDQPIPYTPGPTANTPDLIVRDYWSSNEYYKDADGLIRINNVSSYDDIKMYARKLHMSPDEPEAESSFALSMLAEPEFDEYGIARIPFEIIDEITPSRKANHLRYYDPNYPSVNLYVDLDNRVVYLDRKYNFLTESEDTEITISNYKDFKGIVLESGNLLNVVEIPAAQNATYYYKNLKGGDCYWVDEDMMKPAVFDENGIARLESLNLQAQRRAIVLENWAGGYLGIQGNEIYDLSKISCIKAITSYQKEDIGITFKPSTENPMRYNAEIYFPQPTDGFANKLYLQCFLRADSPQPIILGIRRSQWTGIETDNRIMFRDADQASAQMSVNGNSFLFPTLVSGTMNVNVDLCSSSVSFTLGEVQKANVFELYGEGIEDIITVPTNDGTNQTSVKLEYYDNPKLEFNLGDSAGNLLIPTTGSEGIETDEFGHWTGKYEVVAVSNAASRRRVAAEQRKWCLNVPAKSAITVCVDEENGTVELQSSANANAYFATTLIDGKFNIEPLMKNIKAMKANALRETEPGIYEGDVLIPACDNEWGRTLYLHNDLAISTGYAPMEYVRIVNNDAIQLTQETDLSFYAGLFYGNTILFAANDQQQRVNVRFDKPNSTITFSNVRTAVETPDLQDSLSIRSGNGTLTLTAGSEMNVTVYNVTGTLIKAMKLQADKPLTIALTHGLYIVNGHKVFVK